jgi:hypothetical protein
MCQVGDRLERAWHVCCLAAAPLHTIEMQPDDEQVCVLQGVVFTAVEVAEGAAAPLAAAAGAAAAVRTAAVATGAAAGAATGTAAVAASVAPPAAAAAPVVVAVAVLAVAAVPVVEGAAASRWVLRKAAPASNAALEALSHAGSLRLPRSDQPGSVASEGGRGAAHVCD